MKNVKIMVEKGLEISQEQIKAILDMFEFVDVSSTRSAYRVQWSEQRESEEIQCAYSPSLGGYIDTWEGLVYPVVNNHRDCFRTAFECVNGTKTVCISEMRLGRTLDCVELEEVDA